MKIQKNKSPVKGQTAGKLSRVDYGVAMLSGMLLTASFPKFPFSILAWGALIPLLLSIEGKSVKESFKLGYFVGVIHYLSLLYWLIYTMHVYGQLSIFVSVGILLLLAVYLGLFVGFFAVGVRYVINDTRFSVISSALYSAVLWVALEYFRSFLFSGFPWALLGYSQYHHLTLIQIADITGVYGVSFVIVFVNANLWITARYLKHRKIVQKPVTVKQVATALVLVGIILAGVSGYGYFRRNQIDAYMHAAPKVMVAAVQGNIDQSVKWDEAFKQSTLDIYLGLSEKIRVQKHPELIIWPETAAPFYFLYEYDMSKYLLKGIFDIGAYFLIGSPYFTQNEDGYDLFNSAYLVSPRGKINGRYDKVHLVPYGEYVPLRKWMPFLGKIVAQVGDFKPGQKGNTLPFENYAIGVQICYEIIFPDLSRSMVKNHADIIANITNDAWFATTSAPYQHFSMAVFRAVENRRSLVRAANTGISGFIDPNGRIVEQTGLFTRDVIAQPMPIIKTMSVYTRFGDVFAWVCTIFTGIYLCFGYFGKKRKRVGQRSKTG